MGKSILRTIVFILRCFIVVHIINILFDVATLRRQLKDKREGSYYDWKFGKIFYSVRGTGSPVLLVHGLKPADCGNDMDNLARNLAPNHTVYSIDLLGFGLSEKPWITYTNYLLATLLRDFIKDVIGEKADVYACEGSCLFTLQAKKVFPEQFGKVTVIDPCYSERVVFPKDIALKLKKVVDAPFVGTLLFNLYSLAGGVRFDKAGRYVFTSRLSGLLTTDISASEKLIGEEVAVIVNGEEKRPGEPVPD